jgi:hypothetical protein
MNIFVTSSCPIESAKFLDDKRVVKMALESTQMLCTALNVNGVKTPYKTGHLNHPCTIWARESQANWQWLWQHAMALCEKYTSIYGKQHACVAVLQSIKGLEKALPNKTLSPFANCARSKEKGIDFTMETNVHLAYKLYLNERWNTDKREPKWS